MTWLADNIVYIHDGGRGNPLGVSGHVAMWRHALFSMISDLGLVGLLFFPDRVITNEKLQASRS